MRLARFDRQEFIDHYWRYEPGEHAYFCEPTQQGKSYFINQLLAKTLPELEETRFVSLMPKPRDPATSYWAPRLGLKIIDRWPPPGSWPGRKPAGYVLWPRHLKKADVKANREHLAAVMRPALRDQYWKGNTLTFADDAHIVAVMLGLNDQLEEHLTAGSAMPAGLWLANQKPSGSAATGSLTSFAYSAPTHLVFGHDPDERNIHRFSQIGGVDPEMVAWTVRRLPVHQVQTPSGRKNISEKLYIHKGGPWMCIVGP